MPLSSRILPSWLLLLGFSLTFTMGQARAELPTLHSNEAAPRKIYLEFNGYTHTTWPFADPYHPSCNTPPCGRLAHLPSFFGDEESANWTAAEIAKAITIYEHVAEDFAPFNIDVTLEDSGSYEDREAIRIVIGGGLDDVSPVNLAAGLGPNYAFTKSWILNTGLVASEGRTARQIATTATEEAAHMLGLGYHYFNISGVTSCDIPQTAASLESIMAEASLGPKRTKWWSSLALGVDWHERSFCAERDDIAELLDIIDVRPDDHSHRLESGTVLEDLGRGTNGNVIVEATGVIESNGRMILPEICDIPVYDRYGRVVAYLLPHRRSAVHLSGSRCLLVQGDRQRLIHG